jgi:hypothetical protein
MPKHGCDDIRVVYLPARTEMGAEQRKEASKTAGLSSAT